MRNTSESETGTKSMVRWRQGKSVALSRAREVDDSIFMITCRPSSLRGGEANQSRYFGAGWARA
jgi:hypothetical protein